MKNGKEVNVLIVDDDMHIRQILQEVLEEKGYGVFTAGNGDEALKILENESRVGLIVTDIMMPKKEGVSFIRAVRGKYKNIKIIAITSMVNDEKVLKTSEEFGADLAVKKPCDITKLGDVVDTVLSQSE